MSTSHSVSMVGMTKLYESVRENTSLMDIQLEGKFWDPWRYPMRYDLPHAPPVLSASLNSFQHETNTYPNC